MFVSTDETRHRIKNYKYNGQDRSKLASCWSKFCSKIHVCLVPTHISPNIITLIGLFIVFFNVLVLHVNPFMQHKFLLAAISLFLYQICDALDGLQGRLIGMYNNVTTEIFDHGCDSLVITLTCLQVTLLFNLSLGHALIIFIAASLVFFLPTWEHQWTHVMIFRGGLANPTEGLFSVELFYLLCEYQSCDISLLIPPFSLVFCIYYLSDLVSTVSRIRATCKDFGWSNFVMGWAPISMTIVNSLAISTVPNDSMLIPILCVALPWNLTILQLIFAEITHGRYESNAAYRILLGLQVALFLVVAISAHSWIMIYLKVTTCVYILMWHNIVTIACSALHMPNFYTIMSV